MASIWVSNVGPASAGDKLLARVAEQGSAAHPYPHSSMLSRGADAVRNLADLVHFLCTLHGRHPSVVDHALERAGTPEARAWLSAAAPAFAAERGLLARLAVAAGPLPSTPGAGDAQAAVLGQRHALDMLARSERNGCALGAALALVLDWAAIRPLLDIAAERFGVAPTRPLLDTPRGIRALADASPSPGVERALLFGAEQIAIQHFGLWDLLEARAQARSAN